MKTKKPIATPRTKAVGAATVHIAADGSETIIVPEIPRTRGVHELGGWFVPVDGNGKVHEGLARHVPTPEDAERHQIPLAEFRQMQLRGVEEYLDRISPVGATAAEIAEATERSFLEWLQYIEEGVRDEGGEHYLPLVYHAKAGRPLNVKKRLAEWKRQQRDTQQRASA